MKNKFNLSENITKGDGDECVYHEKDVKKFIIVLKEELLRNEFEKENYVSWEEVIDKLAGKRLI